MSTWTDENKSSSTGHEDVLSKDGDDPDSLYKADVEHLRDIGSEE